MIALARQLELGAEAAREAGMAGLLHDMGKVAMPHEVLSTPGKLTDEECQLMRSHPERGQSLLLGCVSGAGPALERAAAQRLLRAYTAADGVASRCHHSHGEQHEY